MSELVVASTTDAAEDIKRAAGARKLVNEPEPEKEEAEAEPELTAADKQATEARTEEQEEPEPSKKSNFQKRIDKLTRTIYDLKKQVAEQGKGAEEDREAAAEAEAEVEAAEEAKAAEKPKADQFENYEDFVEALADWKADQRIATTLAAQEQKKAQDLQDKAQQAVFDLYNERRDEAKQRYDDFDEVVGRDDLQIPQGVQLLAIEDEKGPDFAYFLGKHPAVAKELCELTPLMAVRKAGQIMDALAGPEPEEEEIVTPKRSSSGRFVAAPASRAPKPIIPVSGSSTKSSVPLDQLEFREYRKIRDQQEKNRYRR